MNKLGDLLHVFAPRVHHVHGASTSLFVLCLCTHGRLNTLDLGRFHRRSWNKLVNTQKMRSSALPTRKSVFWQIPQPVPKTLESHDSRSLKGAAAAWVKAPDLPDLRIGSNRKKMQQTCTNYAKPIFGSSILDFRAPSRNCNHDTCLYQCQSIRNQHLHHCITGWVATVPVGDHLNALIHAAFIRSSSLWPDSTHELGETSCEHGCDKKTTSNTWNPSEINQRWEFPNVYTIYWRIVYLKCFPMLCVVTQGYQPFRADWHKSGCHHRGYGFYSQWNPSSFPTFRLAAHATPGAFHPEQLCLHPFVQWCFTQLKRKKAKPACFVAAMILQWYAGHLQFKGMFFTLKRILTDGLHGVHGVPAI